MPKRTSKKKKPKIPEQTPMVMKKVHPWRVCPAGQHWVRTHPMWVPPSKTNPEGYETTRGGHCALNPSRKDRFYPHEIEEVSSENFSKVINKPCPSDLGFRGGDQYDSLIAGWVQYWNEIFEPKDPLDPNIVKALIATESRFISNMLADKMNQNSARGLMQVTNKTRKILGDEKGELKEHLIEVTRKELNDPNINICAGVRWLFHKKKLASKKHEASWEEVIRKYKGADTVTPARAKELLRRFNEKLEELKKCQKK